MNTTYKDHVEIGPNKAHKVFDEYEQRIDELFLGDHARPTLSGDEYSPYVDWGPGGIGRYHTEQELRKQIEAGLDMIEEAELRMMENHLEGD